MVEQFKPMESAQNQIDSRKNQTMNTQGRTAEHTDHTEKKFIRELLRQLLILAIILIGIVASSLPAAILYQSADNTGSESKKVSEASDSNLNVSTRQHDERLTFVNDTNKRERPRRKTAN